MTFYARLIKYNHAHDELGRFTSTGGERAPKMDLTQVSGQKGSNEGGVYKDAAGKQFYVKFYKNPDQGRTEQLASSLFEMLGAKTPGPKVATVNGKEALVTEWNDKLKQISPSDFGKLNKTQRDQVAKMFMGAVLTKNWDVVGLEHDNIVQHADTGDMVEVDTGGSFKFRAQGNPKPYGEDIAEAKTLMDPQYPAGQVFSKVFNQDPEAEQNALAAVKGLDMREVRDKFMASGLSDWQDLYTSFRARRQKLLENSNL